MSSHVTAPITIPISMTSPSITGDVVSTSTYEIERPKSQQGSAQPFIDDLLLIYEEASPLLRDCVRLLSEAIDLCVHAIQAIDKGQKIVSDDCMQRLGALTPGLFDKRRIGDGYGMLINAIRFSFINKRGIPFSKIEIHSIRRTLEQLRSHPFMGLEDSVAASESLEDAGLEIDPEPLTALLVDAEEMGLTQSD
jgi:hypothetical protein